MAFRVGQEKGRAGWYVYVSKPAQYRKKKGSNTVRKKGGATREEALRNALRIEAEVLGQWEKEFNTNPFAAAQATSRTQGIPLDQALDEELRDQGYRLAERDRIVAGLYDEEELEKQGIEKRLTKKESAQLEEIQSDIRPWSQWVSERKALEDRAASTVVNWETKLKGLAEWYGSAVVGTMTRKDANAYKLFMANKGMSSNSISNISARSVGSGTGSDQR